jgi:hypothetical protein
MQLDELIHPNRHKTHCATPFPYLEIDAEPPAIHARFLPMQLFETIPGFLNPQPANRIRLESNHQVGIAEVIWANAHAFVD